MSVEFLDPGLSYEYSLWRWHPHLMCYHGYFIAGDGSRRIANYHVLFCHWLTVLQVMEGELWVMGLFCARYNMHMLRTDCETDQFINRPLVHKLVVQFAIELACFWRTHGSTSSPVWNLGQTVYEPAKQFINWLNGLQAGWTVYKLTEWFASKTNGIQVGCTVGLQAGRTAHKPGPMAV